MMCALAAAPAKPRAKAKTAPDARSHVVRAWMKQMTLHDRVAQLFVLPFYGDAPNARSEEYQKYLRWVRHLRVGGLVLVNRVQEGRARSSEPYAMAAFLNRMQRASKIPLLVAGDFERGASMRLDSKILFPHAMAFAATRDPELSRYEGMVTAKQGRATGVPWLLAPVADVNNNPDNPIINIRSYSENPDEVAAHVRAFIEGAHSAKPPVLVTVKHFPGHGDTAIDSHLALAVNNADRARIDKVELPPFQAAIDDGVDSVMTAHIAVPALDEQNVPATLSPSILTRLLRETMHFDGIISTDALDMAGVTKQWPAGQAAVKALEAGADVMLMPANPEEAINAVIAAVKRGTLTRERIDRSVRKLLAAKVRLGLDRKRMANLDTMMDELDAPEDVQKAQEVAERAVTLVRNEGNRVPLNAGAKPCFLILTESRGSQQGKAFAAEVKRRMPGVGVVTLDPASSAADLDEAGRNVDACEFVVAAAFASVASYRGHTALAAGYPALLNGILDKGKPVVLVALGNPYVLRAFPKVAGYMTTYSTVVPAEVAAVKALFGEIAIGGKLPVTIPGLANYGDGLQLAATSARSSSSDTPSVIATPATPPSR